MVLATRTSAPNTLLAGTRPKPRPASPTASEISVIMLKSELPHEASPTASEISVIMLKSELPHEAPNPVSKKAPRVHHASRRRGGVAARRAGAAACDAGDRLPQRHRG